MAEPTLESLQQDLAAEIAQNDYLAESMADLELALEDRGWERLAWQMDQEFTRPGLDRLIAISRLNTLKNPLIGRGVRLKAHYVWGQGVEISAPDDTVNEIVQAFLDDRSNRDVLFSAQAAQAKDRTLTTDGNLAFVMVANPLTGKLKIRSITIDEVRDRICNPDDRCEVWFYLRRWVETDGVITGAPRTRTREMWHPDWRFTPPQAERLESINRVPVNWDAPLMHVRVGGLDGMAFGVPETYAAIDWARAYKLFLEDWSTLVRSLSRFAYQLTVKKKPGAAAAKLGTTLSGSQRETNPATVAGSTFVGTDDAQLTPIPKTGATVAAEDGVWLAKMVGAALDLPYTVLMGDPDMGNLATAKTLDRPTELSMKSRQDLSADVLRDMCNYAVDCAARAPLSPLQGAVVVEDGLERVVLPDETDRTVNVVFPPILEQDVKSTIDAIVQAFNTELPDPKLILRLLLQALGVEDVDEMLDNFDDEYAARQANAGDLAVRAFRAGQDPAAVLR